MAIPVRQRGQDPKTEQAEQDAFLFASRNDVTEFWIPSQVYTSNVNFLVEALRHELKELEKQDGGTNTSEVLSLLKDYGQKFVAIEYDEENFIPYIKDPLLLTEKQLQQMTSLLGRFKKNSSIWGVDWLKGFLCCNTENPLKIRRECLPYVCFIMQSLVYKIGLNPDWQRFVAHYKLFQCERKTDLYSLQVTTSQIMKDAQKADRLREGKVYHDEERYESYRRARNELTEGERAKYNKLNELDDFIKAM